MLACCSLIASHGKNYSKILCCETKLRSTAVVEDNELRLKEDITIDSDTDIGIGL